MIENNFCAVLVSNDSFFPFLNTFDRTLTVAKIRVLSKKCPKLSQKVIKQPIMVVLSFCNDVNTANYHLY